MDAKVIAAVELLNAAAKEKKEDLQNLISGKYSNLKAVLSRIPKNLVKENPWWVAGGVALTLLAAAAVFYTFHRMNHK